MFEAIRIAVLTDTHFGEPSVIPARRSEIADQLLSRAVDDLNRTGPPDVTVVPGDLLDKPTAPDSLRRMERLKSILDSLQCPYIAIPGNHDVSANEFFQVFTKPAPFVELCGVRFLAFTDKEMPGYNARRADAELARFRMARDNFHGPIVALQHVCLAPTQLADIPYNYQNVEAIVEAMTTAKVSLSISGHYHAGADPVEREGITFVNAPALCESPFRYLVITLSDGNVEIEQRILQTAGDDSVDDS